MSVPRIECILSAERRIAASSRTAAFRRKARNLPSNISCRRTGLLTRRRRSVPSSFATKQAAAGDRGEDRERHPGRPEEGEHDEDPGNELRLHREQELRERDSRNARSGQRGGSYCRRNEEDRQVCERPPGRRDVAEGLGEYHVRPQFFPPVPECDAGHGASSLDERPQGLPNSEDIHPRRSKSRQGRPSRPARAPRQPALPPSGRRPEILVWTSSLLAASAGAAGRTSTQAAKTAQVRSRTDCLVPRTPPKRSRRYINKLRQPAISAAASEPVPFQGRPPSGSPRSSPRHPRDP